MWSDQDEVKIIEGLDEIVGTLHRIETISDSILSALEEIRDDTTVPDLLTEIVRQSEDIEDAVGTVAYFSQGRIRRMIAAWRHARNVIEQTERGE